MPTAHRQNTPSRATCKLIVEKDVQIPLRDGTILYADVFRPDTTEKVPVIMNIGRVPEGQALGPAGRPRRGGEPVHELGDRQSELVVPARLCVRARRCARLGQIARRFRAELVPGVARLLRCDRMDREARLVFRQRRTAGHFVSRVIAMARREPAAAVAESDHAVGRPRRPVSRPGVSRRHFRAGLHRQLVADAHGAPSARPAAQLQPGRVPQRHDVEIHAQRSRFRILAPVRRALGPDQGAALQRRQLGRLLDASARQHGSAI